MDASVGAWMVVGWLGDWMDGQIIDWMVGWKDL